MSHGADPTAIQGEPEPLTAAANPSGITPSPGASTIQSLRRKDGLQLLGVRLLPRFSVLGAGLALGSAFAVFVAGPMMPSGMPWSDRAAVWAWVMAGPVAGFAWEMADFIPNVTALGCLGLLLVPAHPLCPNVATGCVTVVGLSLWFFAGFATMMCVVWGA
jgi:hypothetical protein